MSVEVITEFLQKGTIRVIAYVRDDDGDLVNPTSCLIELWDAEGTKLQDSTAMSPTVTGTYEHYEYTFCASPVGHWRGVVWAVDGTGATAKYSEASFGFRVKT